MPAAAARGRFKEHPEQAGVVLVKSAAEAKQNAARMLGKTLVTKQTGPAGKMVNVVLVEEGLAIARELYLAVVVDRDAGGPVLIMSSEGGTEIEEVAAHAPEKILREPVDAGYGLFGFQATKLAYKLGLPANAIKSAQKFLPQLVRFFLDNDCSMAEVNPLVVTEDGRHAGPRREGDVRRQRPLPSQAAGGAPRSDRGRRFGNSGGQRGAELRQARRKYRLPGERSRAWR